MNAFKPPSEKPALFVASALRDLRELPSDVQRSFGRAILKAQWGGKSLKAKPLAGFGGAGVLEIVEDDDGSTYRAVYTVKFADAVYVLHVFQKKSTHGIATPQQDIKIVRQRLRAVEEEYAKDHPK